MTIRERLQIIGQTLLGRSTPAVEIVKEVTKNVEKAVGGSFLDFKQVGLSNQKTVSSKVLEANKGWVYRNTDAIATEVGTIEFELYSVRVVGDELVFNPITTHPALDALDRFNSFTDASSGFYITESHRLLSGDAFWYLDGRGADVRGIYPLQPDKVELRFGKIAGSQVIVDGYHFEDTVDGKVVKQDYTSEEVIHFKIPSAKNPYRGYGKVEAAADDIDLDSLAIEANKQLYLRGLIASFVLTTEGKLTQDQLQQLHAEFKASYQGVQNAFKVPILGNGIKPVTTQLTNKDMQFLEHQAWLRDKITSIWGNNKASIGITDDVNRANAEASIDLWRASTIRAEMKAICDTLNEFYIPRFGTNLILGFKDPVGENEADKIEKAKSLKNSDIITLNEAREILGYDNVEGGDEMSFQRSERQASQNAEFSNLPKSLKYVTLKKYVRKWKLYEKIAQYKELEAIARPVAEKIVKSRRKSDERREHLNFTNEKVWAFHSKQIGLVEAQEQVFQNKCEQFINDMVKLALDALPSEVALMQQKALLPEDELIVKAQIDFGPILSDVAMLMGQEAMKLIEADAVFLPTNMRESIAASVKKFTQSMIETDRNKMIDIIAKGLADGKSVPQIRKQIVDTFAEFSKTQAERITRTEVIRASNMAAIDAWDQSGIVVGKQWLTAMDDRVDPLCSYMNGKVINLKGKYFKRGETLEVEDAKTTFNYGAVKEPPLHANCRCTLLPVLVGENAFDADSYLKVRSMETDKQELEAKLDKRTKSFRELKERNLELEQYVKELEALVDEELQNSQAEG